MPLLIDGHNLIGSGVFDDIKLHHEDDEARLVARLRAWRSRYPHKIIVVFDHGITEGRSGHLSGGGVEVRFARNPTDADELILRRIRHRTPNLTVVTNDRRLRREASLYNVEVWRPYDFVEQMMEPPAPRRQSRAAKKPGTRNNAVASEIEVSETEVDEWMELFEGEGDNCDETYWTPPRQRPDWQQGKQHGKRRKR